MANGNGQIQVFRAWLTDLRAEFNKKIDERLGLLDEMENQALKKPSVQDPVFELDLKGKPDRA